MFFGASGRSRTRTGETSEYQIVGPDEFDVAAGRITIDSPLGRALLGRVVGDELLVDRPKGRVAFTVAGIRYPDPDADD